MTSSHSPSANEVSKSSHDSLHGTLLGIATEGPWLHAPLLARLPPQQSSLSRHRTWSFAHSCQQLRSIPLSCSET